MTSVTGTVPAGYVGAVASIGADEYRPCTKAPSSTRPRLVTPTAPR